MTLPANFISKTRPATDCVVWAGAQNSRGYGCFGVNGLSQLSHRVAWEDAHGPIPDGLTIDHLCRVRSCVNVAHMELVTSPENTRRAIALRVGGECKRGHALSGDADIYHRANGIAECRECRRAAKRRHSERAA